MIVDGLISQLKLDVITAEFYQAFFDTRCDRLIKHLLGQYKAIYIINSNNSDLAILLSRKLLVE